MAGGPLDDVVGHQTIPFEKLLFLKVVSETSGSYSRVTYPKPFYDVGKVTAEIKWATLPSFSAI